MTGDELTAGLRADFDALEHITGLVTELYWRVSHVEDASGPVELGMRAARAHQTRLALAELGVDLNLPDLQTLLAALVARTSSGTVTADPESPTETPSPSVPLEPTEADWFTEDAPVDAVTSDAGDEDQLIPDPGWQAGDPCSACESTNTALAENGAAYCNDCGAHDVDEVQE